MIGLSQGQGKEYSKSAPQKVNLPTAPACTGFTPASFDNIGLEMPSCERPGLLSFCTKCGQVGTFPWIHCGSRYTRPQHFDSGPSTPRTRTISAGSVAANKRFKAWKGTTDKGFVRWHDEHSTRQANKPHSAVHVDGIHRQKAFGTWPSDYVPEGECHQSDSQPSPDVIRRSILAISSLRSRVSV
jgi:hypothetical protein